MENTKRFFAFISYSRTDIKAATYIQVSLEHFRYPRESIKKEFLPEDSEFVREIFLDRTKLSGRGPSFEENLESALAASRYLILLCSPEAASLKSDPKLKHYVEWEIQTFLRLHGENAKKRIIPVIVRGEPDLTENSCLPRPVRSDEFRSRNLPDMRPVRGQKLGIFGRRQAWHSAVVTLLSYIFDVERCIIFDRFAAERARARMRIGIAASIAAILILAIGCLALFERSRKLDAAAWRHLSIAQHYLENTDATSAFGKSDLALPHLSLAARLPAAGEYLINQLFQRPWIIPIEQTGRTNAPAIPSAFRPSNVEFPVDFPLSFTNVNGRISAFSTNRHDRIWSARDDFNVYRARVAPMGLVLVTLRHHPAFSIDGLDPYTGRHLWSKRLNSMLRDFQFSADGRHLAILSFTGQLTILKSETGEREYETLHVGADSQRIQFSVDGNKLFVETPSRTIVCRLIRQILEIPIGVKKMPIVHCNVSPNGDTFALTSKCATGGFSTAWDSKTLSVTEDKELKEGDVVCEYLTNRTSVASRTATGRKEVSASSSDFIAKTIDDNCVQLFGKKSLRPVSEAFEMPAIVKHLNFISNGTRDYLLVGGGAESVLRGANTQGFYAIIDATARTLLHLRSGLEGQVTASFKLRGAQCLLHGTNNTRDWVITLPSGVKTTTEADLSSICTLLSGRRMSQDEVPIPSLAFAVNISLSETLQRFVVDSLLPTEKRHTSFVSSIPSSVVIAQLSDGPLSDLEKTLDLSPTDPQAIAAYWIPVSRAFIKAKYVQAHPELSNYEIEQRFAAYSPSQWAESIREDTKSMYLADRITAYSLACNPTSDTARSDRDAFLVFAGRKAPQTSTTSAVLQKWQSFSADKQGDILVNPQLANEMAAASCDNKESFSSYLSQLRTLLARSMQLKELDMDRNVAIASLVGDISAWAMDINNCDESFLAFLEALADSTQHAKPTIFADQLRSQILLLALEKSIRIGDGRRASDLRGKISRIEHPDITTPQMLSFFDIFHPLCAGNSGESKRRYDAEKSKDGIMFTAMGKSIWDILTEMKQHRVVLGELSAEYDKLTQLYAAGVLIKVESGSVAEELGWKDGDAILKINDHIISDEKTLNAFLTIRRKQSLSHPARFTLIRNGQFIKSETNKLTLGIRF